MFPNNTEAGLFDFYFYSLDLISHFFVISKVLAMSLTLCHPEQRKRGSVDNMTGPILSSFVLWSLNPNVGQNS